MNLTHADIVCVLKIDMNGKNLKELFFIFGHIKWGYNGKNLL